MSFIEVLLWVFLAFWLMGAAAQWGFSMGRQWESKQIHALMTRLSPTDFDRAIFRGMVLTLVAWPYLTYRDFLSESKKENDHES